MIIAEEDVDNIIMLFVSRNPRERYTEYTFHYVSWLLWVELLEDFE